MYRITTAIAVLFFSNSFIFAQGPPPDRMFGYLDRDGDGRLSKEEMDRVQGGFRDMLTKAGIREGVTRDDFMNRFAKVQEEFRRGRESSDGDRDSDRGRGDDDRRRDDDRDRSSSSSSSSSSSQSRTPAGPAIYKPAPRDRVTVDLPETFLQFDTDGDGQIALHEWRRTADRIQILEFFEKDLNKDGFLTPRELLPRVEDTPAPKMSDDDTQRAKESFRMLDANKNGKVEPGEWAVSRRLKPQFEAAKINLNVDMTEVQFVANYARSTVGGDSRR